MEADLAIRLADAEGDTELQAKINNVAAILAQVDPCY
jgi:hypothetical protein